MCQIALKSMHYCTSYGPDKSGRMHGRTHMHRTKIETTMSRLPASGLDKNGAQHVTGTARIKLASEASCIVILFYVHGKHPRSCRDGQLT